MQGCGDVLATLIRHNSVKPSQELIKRRWRRPWCSRVNPLFIENWKPRQPGDKARGEREEFEPILTRQRTRGHDLGEHRNAEDEKEVQSPVMGVQQRCSGYRGESNSTLGVLGPVSNPQIKKCC